LRKTLATVLTCVSFPSLFHHRYLLPLPLLLLPLPLLLRHLHPLSWKWGKARHGQNGWYLALVVLLAWMRHAKK
jgi:hypothetical protein